MKNHPVVIRAGSYNKNYRILRAIFLRAFIQTHFLALKNREIILHMGAVGLQMKATLAFSNISAQKSQVFTLTSVDVAIHKLMLTFYLVLGCCSKICISEGPSPPEVLLGLRQLPGCLVPISSCASWLDWEFLCLPWFLQHLFQDDLHPAVTAYIKVDVFIKCYRIIES